MEIPDDKKYFRIGEVSRIIGVRPYVLRYWESEFPQIRPHRADSNQRTYQKKDLETIFRIKKLLKEDRSNPPPVEKELLKEIKSELRDILKTL
jgi:DNA-binding transcriptional MerR regulator